MPGRRGRLLGLVAAGVVESRDLFPDPAVDILYQDIAEMIKTLLAQKRPGRRLPTLERRLDLDRPHGPDLRPPRQLARKSSTSE